MDNRQPVYCCIPIEFIQPWDQNEAIRQVKELGLGNMVIVQGTFHVGSSDEDRRLWKERFPSLTDRIDATPRFPERPEHGMAALFNLPMEFHIEQLRLCRELGLKVLCFFPGLLHLPSEDRCRLAEAGKGTVLTEMILCENASILGSTLSLEQLKQMDAKPVASHVESCFTRARPDAGPSVFDDPGRLDFRAVHDWFVGRFRAAGETIRSHGIDLLGAVEATSQMRLAMEAGVDVPVLELVPHEPLRGLAAVRGAARAYGKPLWGVHTAMGYYRAPSDAWTPERLRIAYDLFFAGGASIFSECNMPLRNWGSCSAFFTIRATPPIREGEVECREFDDPICARAREVVAEHYRFTQFHLRPERGPRVPLGFVLGNLDGWTGGQQQDGRMWLVDLPGFLAPDALSTWRHFDRAFDAEPWYVPPRKYYWQADPSKPLRHGTPPCGQVDIVPIEAPLEVLRSYASLTFLGWNTMTDALYAKLTAFVEGGGTLFLSVPHLSTRTRADQPQAFVRGGDVRDLCGARIVGPGAAIEEVYLAEQTRFERYSFPKGTLYLEEAPLARLELHDVRVLAHPREKPEQPVLIERRLGKGCVYLLATWEYPGARLDAFITDILRTLAEGAQPPSRSARLTPALEKPRDDGSPSAVRTEIAVRGRDVFYAVYDGELPSGTPFSTVYMVNHDIYGQPAYPDLIVDGRRIPLRVGRDLGIAWIAADLLIAPRDRFVKVTDVRPTKDGWTVTLDAAPATRDGAADAERTIQLAALRGSIATVELDGRPLPTEPLSDGDQVVRCRLAGRHVLRVT